MVRSIIIVGCCVLASCTSAGTAPTSAPIQLPSTTTSAPIQLPSTTTLPTTTTAPTTTTTPPPEGPVLHDVNVIGIWPYRSATAALTDSRPEPTDGALIDRFLVERIGWTGAVISDGTDGTDSAGYFMDSPQGELFVGTRIVGHAADGSAITVIVYASSLDAIEDGWGPGLDIGETEDGWSALVFASPIGKLVAQVGVSGPFAQLGYGDWQSELTLIGENGASISIPDEPINPGVLWIWYLRSDGTVAGFAGLMIPPGTFVAG